MAGLLFVFSAPSGAGKSTIVDAIRGSLPGFGYSISHTTRKIRGGERDGVDYHFVDRDTFKQMAVKGAFVEWAKVYDDLYGTSLSGMEEQVLSGRDVLLDLDPKGAKNIKRRFEDTVLVYILPPSLEVLEKRLRERNTDQDDVIEYRMNQASREIKECAWYDYVIINDNLEGAIDEAKAIVTAERCRTSRRLSDLQKIFDLS